MHLGLRDERLNSFPLPADRIRYAHPTDKPNRAGVQVVEGR